MERRLTDETTVPMAATVGTNTADMSQPHEETWEARAEHCLRDLWRFLNRKVIDLHAAGRLADAAELSDVREQVHALLRERPQQPNGTDEADGLHHPITQLAEGSGLPTSDDPETYMPSLP
jgi:hypothetical protein